MTEGGLRYFAARQIVICVQTPLGRLEAAHILFQRDGSISVQFPKCRFTDGVVTEVPPPDDGTIPSTFRFLDRGKVTSHLVKLSHHVDGTALFSQDGRVQSAIRRRAAFPLDGPIGKLFDLHVFFPHGALRPVGRERPSRPYLTFSFPDRLPYGFRISAEWRRKRDLGGWSASGEVIGPAVRIRSRVTGEDHRVFLIGEPPNLPMQDHLLVVFYKRAPVPRGVDCPLVILFGGYDSDEVPEPGMVAPPSGFLAAMYPVRNREKLENIIGSIDLDLARSSRERLS